MDSGLFVAFLRCQLVYLASILLKIFALGDGVRLQAGTYTSVKKARIIELSTLKQEKLAPFPRTHKKSGISLSKKFDYIEVIVVRNLTKN